MFDLEKRFCFGMNVDDSWRYAGSKEPKSIIIPHLLSVSLPEGRVLEAFDEAVIESSVNGPWRSFPEQENHFGLIDSKGGFKEAWRAYGEIVRS